MTDSGAGGDLQYRFSYGRFVLFVLGAGVIVLVICIPVVLALARWNAIAGLVASLVSIVLMITAIGITSKRLIGKAERALRAQHRSNPPSS
ncbi:hypothetical protein EF294_08395 [Gordonia oryzae]|uniref:Uncharacterized protein n=1 Tax=Gordonia oryzae TaxID=2487349 RepID=A0A3N4GMX8_9ACTN|nr:hypothetical protein [Gordonia oryzae]RPA63505.1 hypothetical protein EF294_08395 [Gordonia oryzae]